MTKIQKDLLVVVELIRETSMGHVELALDLLNYADAVEKMAVEEGDEKCQVLLNRLYESSIVQERIQKIQQNRGSN